VRPASVPELVVRGAYVAISAGWDTFGVSDLADADNEPRVIPSKYTGVKGIRAMYALVRDHGDELAEMTFSEVLDEMRARGIASHYYCARD
jgi:hypothetical protein